MKKYDKSFIRKMLTNDNQKLIAHFRVKLVVNEDQLPWFTKAYTLMVNVFYYAQTNGRTLSKTNNNYCLIQNMHEWTFNEILGNKLNLVTEDQMTPLQSWIKDRVIFEFEHK